MKNIKTILVLLFLSICISSCSNDDSTTSKEYPENMINRWDGTVRETDFGNTPETALIWNIKANGVLEVLNGAQSVTGEWYMNGNVFNCTYTVNTTTYTYQLIKNKNLVMVGFRGLNGETSGAGRVYIFVI